MDKVTIVDNYLEEDSFVYLRKVLKDGSFPWYRCFILSPDKFLSPGGENLQFTHFFYQNFGPSSSQFAELAPILNRINPSALIRIKANLKNPSGKPTPQGFHQDQVSIQNESLRVGIFYLTDSDGGTMFKSGQVVESKANRYIEFSNSLEHSGMSHTYPNDRIVINFNFFR